MASQISHVVYGEKVKDLYLKDRVINEKKFFIGTLFPDIRFLAKLDREKTHIFNPVSERLETIESDFELGLYVHSLVDYNWSKSLERSGIFNLVSREPLNLEATKVIDDEIVYPYFRDWEKIVGYFNDILDEEIALVPEDHVRKWHTVLQLYFSSPPIREKEIKLAKMMNYNENTIEALLKKINELVGKEPVISAIRSIYETFSI